MNHQEFINKWLGKRYAESQQLGYQCVALCKLYCSERGRGQLPSFGGSAYNGWLNTKNTFDLTKYLRVANAPQLYPSQGDIVIFAPTGSNPYGHIGICHNADLETMDIISQNGKTGNGKGLGDDAIVHRNYIYKGCCGRYHYRQQETPLITPDEKATSTIGELSATDKYNIDQLIADGFFNGEFTIDFPKRTAIIVARIYNLIKQKGN